MKPRSLYPVPLYLGAGLLSLFPLLGDPQQVLLWRGGAFSDLMISHWPNAEFVRRSIVTWGQLPLWNPTILSGAPLAGDPLAGIWYPPTWLAVLLPRALGFNLLIWLHLAWCGIGGWALARRLGRGHAAAVIAGLALSATPKLLGHVGLGHVGLVFAVSWTPWALLAADSAAAAIRGGARRGGGASDREQVARAALAGAVAGIAFLADPRWYPGLALLVVAFYLWRSAHGRPGRRLLLIGLGGAASLAVSAVLALPLLEFSRLSTRAGLSAEEAAALSLPMQRLSGLLAPQLGAWPEWQPYAGAVVLYLAALAVFGSLREARFWIGLALLGLLFAVGETTPFYALARALVPGVSQLRVPPRSLLLVALALAMLAGLGVDSLPRLSRRRVGYLAGGLLALYLVGGAASWAASAGRLPQERTIAVVAWVTSAAFLAIAAIWSGGAFRRRFSPPAFAIVLAALLVMDLTLVNLTTLKAEPVVADPVAQAVAERTPPGQRVFSPSYSVRQPSAAALGLQTADGVNPLQLAHYADFMRAAAGIERTGYSVTLPPYPSGSVSEPWGFEPDLERLGLLGISTIAAAYPLEETGLELLEQVQGQYLYRNPAARPRAWLQGPEGVVPIQQIRWTPNRIELPVASGGRLVLSELIYPGWTAAVDGKQQPIEPYAGLLRSVAVPPGPHQVVFTYRPFTLLAGALITGLGLLITTSLWIRR